MLIVAFISGGLVYSLGDENKKVSDYICYSCPSVQSLPPSSSNPFEKALQSVFIKYELGDLFTDNAWQLWVIVIMILGISCLSAYLIVKSLEIFDIEIVKKGNEIVLLPLGVLTFIIGVELDGSYFDIGVNRIKEYIESNNMNADLNLKCGLNI